MKIAIYVFSGTGNTLKVANLYKDELTGGGGIAGCQVDVFSITHDNSSLPSPLEYDMVGFGYPVHAFNAPEVFINFVKGLTLGVGKEFFVFKTQGEPLWPNDCSSMQLIKILQKKGYTYLSEQSYIMPYNIIYRHSEDMASLMFHYAKKLVRYHTKKVRQKTQEKWRLPIYKTFHMPIMRVEWPLARMHGKKFKVEYDKCKSCSLCVKLCPMANIIEEACQTPKPVEQDVECKQGQKQNADKSQEQEQKNEKRQTQKPKKETDDCQVSCAAGKRYKFGNKCALCGACYMFCPTSAIRIGWLEGWKVCGEYKFVPINDKKAQEILESGLKKMYVKHFKKVQELLEPVFMD